MTRSNLRSGEASKRTLRRRSDELTQHRHVASGGSDLVQLRHEVKSLSNEDQKWLFQEMEFKIEISAQTGLAMKANLCLSWNRMRTMRR